MEILYILKQSGKTRITSDQDEKFPGLSLFSNTKSPQELNNNKLMRDTLDYIIDVSKKTDVAPNKINIYKRGEYRYYYSVSAEETYGVVIPASENVLNPEQAHALFKKIELATDAKQLQTIVADPAKAIETIFDRTHKAIDKAKEQMIVNIDELIKRGEKIEQLDAKAKTLNEVQAVKFAKSAKQLLPWYVRFCSYFTFSSYAAATGEPVTPRPSTQLNK
jgi:hypothetical protein